MILELVKTLTGALLVAALALVVSKIIANRWALKRFKKLSRGLPMCSGAKLLGNHATSVIFGKNNCEFLRKSHQKLGKTIGYLNGSKCFVSTTDLELIKTFIQDEQDVHMDRWTVDIPLKEFEDSIMTAPKDEWQQLRRAIAPALAPNKFKTPNVLQEIEDSIEKLIGLIETRLATEKPSYLFDIDDLVHRYAANLVFSCFYKQSNLIEFDNPNDLWIELIENGLTQLNTSPFVHLSVVFPIFRDFIDWLVWHFHEQGYVRKTVLEFVKSQTILGIEARKQLKELKLEAQKTGTKIDPNNFLLKDGTRFKRNLIDNIVDQYLDGKLSKTQYLNNSCFLMAAANRTASDCLGHTIYLLAAYQQVQDKLRNSLMADGIESEYLDWVFKESLRLLPPAPIGCSRTVSRDIQLEGGYVLPSGTGVHTNAYVIHRLKEYWGEDADEFKPERWQDTSHHHPYQYIPFGAGPRACPGKMFAIHEMKMLVVALLTRYKFEGEPRDDAYMFDSPHFIFVIPSSTTKVKISKITDL